MGEQDLAKQIVARVGQCVLTCAGTACFSGLDGDGTAGLGRALRYFGDGFQSSKRLGGRRYWRVPVMDGEFLVEDAVGVQGGVGGGNFLILCTTGEVARASALAAIGAMRRLPNIVMPFPGGVVRSGSKVGSRYKGLIASTNDAYCPTIRGQAARTALPDEVGCRAGDRHRRPERGGRRHRHGGWRARCLQPGPGRRGGGDQRRQLWRPARALPLPPAPGAAMKPVRLRFNRPTTLPVDARALDPAALAGRNAAELSVISLQVGNRRVPLGELAEITAGETDHLIVEGSFASLDRLGHGMGGGRLEIYGDVGAYLGQGMSGGRIELFGSAGVYTAANMRGGTIHVTADVGDFLAAALPGDAAGDGGRHGPGRR